MASRFLSSDELRFVLADDETDQTIHAEVFATMRYLLRRRLELRRPSDIHRRDPHYSARTPAVYPDGPAL